MVHLCELDHWTPTQLPMHSHSLKLSVSVLSLILVGLGFSAGCTRTKILLNTPNAHTDYIIGRTYSLKVPVYLKDGAVFKLGFDGTPADYASFKTRHPEFTLIGAKSEFVVTQVQVVSAPEIGSRTRVFARIQSSSSPQAEVEITWISRRDYSAVFTGVDTNIAALIK